MSWKILNGCQCCIFLTTKSSILSNSSCLVRITYHWVSFFPLTVLFFLMGRPKTSFLPSTGRSLDCLLPEPGLMPQSMIMSNLDIFGLGKLAIIVTIIVQNCLSMSKIFLHSALL